MTHPIDGIYEEQPGLHCLSRNWGHLTVRMTRESDDTTYGWWCLWCGTAAYDDEILQQEIKHGSEGVESGNS